MTEEQNRLIWIIATVLISVMGVVCVFFSVVQGDGSLFVKLDETEEAAPVYYGSPEAGGSYVETTTDQGQTGVVPPEMSDRLNDVMTMEGMTTDTQSAPAPVEEAPVEAAPAEEIPSENLNEIPVEPLPAVDPALQDAPVDDSAGYYEESSDSGSSSGDSGSDSGSEESSDSGSSDDTEWADEDFWREYDRTHPNGPDGAL